MNAFDRIAEAKLREAIEAGAFENLALAGQPLKLEDLSRVPQELRASYSVLRNAGYLPEEVQLLEEIHHLRDLLAHIEEEGLEGEGGEDGEGPRSKRARILGEDLAAKVLRYKLLKEGRLLRELKRPGRP